MADLAKYKEHFYRDIHPSLPNEWEVDEVFEHLAGLDERFVPPLLSQVPVIWPVSHVLCFDYISNTSGSIQNIGVGLLGEWVRNILAVYEKHGLVAARKFMQDVETNFLAPLRGEAGVGLEEIEVWMLPYLRGISGLPLELGFGPVPSTDTREIVLPSRISLFAAREDNRQFYKYAAGLQWAHIRLRLYQHLLAMFDRGDPLRQFRDRKLALTTFGLLQFHRANSFLARELPGLLRRGQQLLGQYLFTLPHKEMTPFAEWRKIMLACAGDQRSILEAGSVFPFILKLQQLSCRENAAQYLSLLPAAYEQLAPFFSGQSGDLLDLWLGKFDFGAAAGTIETYRQEREKKFTALAAAVLTPLGDGEKENEIPAGQNKVQADALMLILTQGKERVEKNNHDNMPGETDLDVPEELLALAKEIEEDLGTVPEAYMNAAVGMAGHGAFRGESGDTGATAHMEVLSRYVYDEWDYRRGGYRVDWCSLYEKDMNPVQSTFVDRTLEKYRPQLSRLKRQFEMLRTQHRFVRRRKEGNEIDLDALIEALGDSRAGLSASDRLFIQLLRNDRDISALFLVDMSNSTQGWVGVAIKEALVLLAEALEVSQDQYGIYGFSGMRRSRCELYHVKHLREQYGKAVQQRISAIKPMEYTRMGPPIRHLTRELLKQSGKVRLLLVLSDGKPEDYDDYKGRYAVEDTRKALLEARGAGVYSFCITIDRAAHEYLGHMFGAGNYVFIQDIFTLPARMAEMYRLLTS